MRAGIEMFIAVLNIKCYVILCIVFTDSACVVRGMLRSAGSILSSSPRDPLDHFACLCCWLFNKVGKGGERGCCVLCASCSLALTISSVAALPSLSWSLLPVRMKCTPAVLIFPAGFLLSAVLLLPSLFTSPSGGCHRPLKSSYTSTSSSFSR